jgi:hypothetical protein
MLPPTIELEPRHKQKQKQKMTADKGTSRVPHFDFMKLPLELRRMIYEHCDFKATFTIDAEVLRKYVKGKPINICGFIDVATSFRAETFEHVFRQNAIDLIDIKAVMVIATNYIRKTQVPGFCIWQKIHTVKVDIKSQSTLRRSQASLPLCTAMRTLQMTTTNTRAFAILGYCRNLGILELLDGMEHLETVVIANPLRSVSWDAMPISQVSEGAKAGMRFGNATSQDLIRRGKFKVLSSLD